MSCSDIVICLFGGVKIFLVLSILFFISFFFFKQKTAYEIYQCDLSSDVCSSDLLKVVAEGVTRLTGPEKGFLIITHYQRMLDYITPDIVHVFVDGRIVETGGADLAKSIEVSGYDEYRVGL